MSSFSYEERLLAPNGPCVVHPDNSSDELLHYVGFRERRFYGMELEEVEGFFPLEGQLYRRMRG